MTEEQRTISHLRAALHSWRHAARQLAEKVKLVALGQCFDHAGNCCRDWCQMCQDAEAANTEAIAMADDVLHRVTPPPGDGEPTP
jgi:hypothetical protein